MKKLLSVMLALALCLGAVPAPAEDTLYSFPALGMEITLPENARDMGLDVIAQENLLNLTFQNDEVFTALLLVERMDTETYELYFGDETLAQQLRDMGMRILGQQEGYTYYAFFASDFENTADYFINVLGVDYSLYSADTKAQIEKAIPAVKAASETLSFIPIVPEEKKVGAFTTTDLEGNEVTEEIFRGYDLTVINVWGTFCGPCIGEMPELAAWHKALPENVQLIGVISDVSVGGNTDTARGILEETGVEFVNLLTSEGLYPLLNMSQYVPTTYFVDREGKMVGDAIVGANVEGYKQFVEDYLNE